MVAELKRNGGRPYPLDPGLALVVWEVIAILRVAWHMLWALKGVDDRSGISGSKARVHDATFSGLDAVLRTTRERGGREQV